MTFSLHQLEYVQALAEHRHFGRAAESLYISQPALTRSIQSLERSLGVRLFDRHRRGGVEPTQFGRLLLERGQDILLRKDELIRELTLMQGLEIGELSVSAGLYPAEMSVHKAVGRMIRKHPNVKCRITLRNWRRATEDVLNRKADIALAETSEAEKDERLSIEGVGQHRFIFFCRRGHPILKVRRITMDELFAFPWVSTRAPARITRFFPKALGSAGSIDKTYGDFLSSILVDSFAAAKQVILESDGIGAAPPVVIAKQLDDGELCEIPFQAPWMRLNYGFIYLRDRSLSAAATAFISEVKAIEAKLVETA